MDLCWISQDNTAYIGSGRKGRRKGSKNRSFLEKIEEKEQKNETKRRNERLRVKNISYQYNRLRKALGDPHPEKKLRKQQVLNASIQYIIEMQTLLNSNSSGEMENEQTVSDDARSESSSVCALQLQCEEVLTLTPELSSPIPPMDAHYQNNYLSFNQHMPPLDMAPPLSIPGGMPMVTGMSPCHFQVSPLFEWNMGADVELLEEYSFFNSPVSIQPVHFPPSPPISRPIFPPPPLHHLY